MASSIEENSCLYVRDFSLHGKGDSRLYIEKRILYVETRFPLLYRDELSLLYIEKRGLYTEEGHPLLDLERTILFLHVEKVLYVETGYIFSIEENSRSI